MKTVNWVQIILISSWLLATMVYGWQIYLNNMSYGSGETIRNLEETEASLTLENALLENKIAEAKSLKYVSVEATKAGFIPVKRVEYVID